MAIATLLKKVKQLQALVALRRDEPRAVEALRENPAKVLLQAGMVPDAWQDQVLRSPAQRMLLLATRQGGKSSVSAALALHTALVKPGAPVLLLSPSQRQSGELFRKVI